MQMEGIKPDRITFLALLKAISGIGSIHEGKHIHSKLVESGIPLDVSLGGTLVDMYAKCESLEEAWQVFFKLSQHNVVSWTTIIAACAQLGRGEDALYIFQKMQQEGVQPDHVTYLCAMKACSSITTLDQGRLIHCALVSCGLESDLTIGNNLIDMYVACGNIDEARKVFVRMPKHEVVSWNAMIDGCVQQGFCEDALYFFRRMQLQGLKPNRVTFVGVLKACGKSITLDQDRLIHSQLVEYRLESDLFVANSLIDMYAKCGSIEEAHEVFLKLSEHDVVSWNTMIDGYAQLGHGQNALELFQKMQGEGIQPNEWTYVSVLIACSHFGLVGEGFDLFHVAACVLMSTTFMLLLVDE